MSDTDQITYGRTARLRLAVADQAADISDSAKGMVPTYADGYAHHGEFVGMANRVLSDAKHLVGLAVAYERRRGTSWEDIGEALGISKQAAHERYAEIEKRIENAAIESWLTGDPRQSYLPAAAADPEQGAALLDRWVIDRMVATDPLSRYTDDDPDRARPVSSGLPVMDTLEHSGLVISAAALISDLRRTGTDDDQLAALELGYARRKVELYERLIADYHAGRRHTDLDELRDLLAGCQTRLAKLEEGDDLAARRTERA